MLRIIGFKNCYLRLRHAETSDKAVAYEIFIAEVRGKYKHDLKYCKIINTVEKYLVNIKTIYSGTVS